MIYKILGCIALMLALFTLLAWRVHTTFYMERTFDAPVGKVWKVWTDEDSIRKWWGPSGYTAPIIKNDVRVGGTYLWSMRSPKGEMFWNAGIYKEVFINKRIVSTMSFSNENGQAIPGSKVPVPGHWPNEIIVIAEFTESAGKTTVRVTEVGIPLIVKPLAKIGWSQQFDKIRSLI